MTTVDLILAAIVLLSMLFGAIRGFLRESVALLGWLVGLWLAWRYGHLLYPYLGGALAGTELQSWVARGIVLLTVVVAAWLVGGLLSYLVQRSGLTVGVDRLLGGVFGRPLLAEHRLCECDSQRAPQALRAGSDLREDRGFHLALGQRAERSFDRWTRKPRIADQPHRPGPDGGQGVFEQRARRAVVQPAAEVERPERFQGQLRLLRL